MQFNVKAETLDDEIRSETGDVSQTSAGGRPSL